MFWSILRIVLFVALVAAVALGADFLMQRDEGLRVIVGGTEYPLNALQTVIVIGLLVVAGYLLFKLASLLLAVLKWINGDETAFSRYFDRQSERKGYQALSEGLMALASGEGRLAMAKASKANKYLNRPDLTNLITAQAAEMIGDTRKAEDVYKKLLKDDGTRFVGVRGIMKQKLASGDTATALKLAERAFAIKPRHEEVQDTLLQLQAGSEDWAGARKTLAAKLKHGTLPRDVYNRRDAVLALSQAQEISDDAASAKAAEAAIQANKTSPDLIPAAALAARAYIAQGRKRNAAKVLRKTWDVQPHPDLAAAFAAIEPDETPAQRVKRFDQLIRIKPDHRETKLLKAELNLAAEDFPAARRALGDLVENDPDARVLAVMAAVERGEGAPDAVVRGWLARALTAPRGPQWVCDKCHTIHAEWTPLCTNCSAFDTLSWTKPPQSEVVLPAGADMLPLIVGAIQDTSAETSAETPPEDPDIIEVNPSRDGPAPKPEAAPEDAEIVDGAEPVKEGAK